MGRMFAAAMGCVAYSTILIRGVLQNHSLESAMLNASVCLFLFGAIGYGLGCIANKTMMEAVETRFLKELKPTEPTTPESKESD